MADPRPTRIVCDVGRCPDAVTVDALARLQLGGAGARLELRLLDASAELIALIAFVGLDGVLRVEAGGQPEEREQRLGVEEERELDDPAV